MKTSIIISVLPLLFLSCQAKQEQNNPASLVGVYSNKAEGFKIVTLTLGRNGAGFLSGAVVNVPVRKWHYDEDNKTVLIEGLFGKDNSPEEIRSIYDPSAKTLKGKDKKFGGVLKLITDKRALSFLNRWDKIPDKDAFAAAREYAKNNVAHDKDKMIITTMNIVDPVIEKYLIGRGFSLNANDECFAITGYSRGQMNQRTVQLRKDGGVWKVVKEK